MFTKFTQFIGRLSFETINNNSGQVTQREHKNTHYTTYTCSVVTPRPNRNLLTSSVSTTMAGVG